jgi:preprotein translocase subunit SecG
MSVFKVILTILEVIASVAMIVVVLLQSGKQAGLSGAIAGNSDSYLSKTKNGSLDKMLASATKWIALAWVVLTLSLSLVH